MGQMACVERALQIAAEDLRERGGIDIPRSLHRRDLQFRKKRGLYVGKTKRGKGTEIMAIADANGLPVAVCIASASPHK